MSRIILSGHTPTAPINPGHASIPEEGLLAEIATFWREFIKAAFVPYYPERHYMRGPGPACAAKRRAEGK